MLPNPQPYFGTLVDPRRETRNKLHALQDIVMITLCATLCGHDDWVGIEDFAHENEAWLRELLPRANGIPSHDTLSDVIGRLERKAFAEAFARWMQDSLPSLDARHIALDGKTLRGSRQNGSAVHLMSAFAIEARRVLTQHGVPGKANEITALPDLMTQVDLRGAVISIDAIGCQKTVAEQIVAAKADYVLALKDKQPQGSLGQQPGRGTPRGTEPDTTERQQSTERWPAAHASLHQCAVPNPTAVWPGCLIARLP
ncbi:Transposase DDE domain-containing protein [Azotobacter beijerinckii]|uniref:Transposase DDE domain-containing protein n=1 Tax=Azotobacter beijerinckii TaxID=170623 RepID=A0A1H9P8X4_9GAMM|nr:ISAs1 family transposase [Azotobacter beijerinckii]SER44650.1 Transposase DDE domain-containing protein [Azotobacter beijerinckii]